MRVKLVPVPSVYLLTAKPYEQKIADMTVS